jgi:hypothetical protein
MTNLASFSSDRVVVDCTISREGKVSCCLLFGIIDSHTFTRF